MNEMKWVTAPPAETAGGLAAAFGLSPVIGQILANRGITDHEGARFFLHGGFDDIPDPFLMTGMETATARILAAIEAGERILIFGDYDADGILSTVMLSKALVSLGGEVDCFIPDRLTDGYGIKDGHLGVATDRGVRLVISVDCGIKSAGFVRAARAAGVDVIITDHHLPGPELPAAVALLDPALPGANYPDRSLAGVGVVFKLIQALFQKTGRTSVLRHYLKLVAIGTIADVAELRGENRILVRRGLAELDHVANLGLQSLIAVCGLQGRRISVADVGFRLGPRLNVAGRMGRIDLALKLLMSNSAEETSALARELDDLNSRRQAEEERIFNQAAERIRARGWDRDYKVLILGDEAWSRGIVGIVASRLKETFNRPVVLFAYENGMAYGSGRSVADFSLIECLDETGPLFLSYGGHRLAAGCTLRREAVPEFKAAVNRTAASRFPDSVPPRTLFIDARLDFSGIDAALWNGLSLLEPHGVGNPRPVFLTEGADIAAEPRRLRDRHAKFLLRQSGRTFEAIGWDHGEWLDRFGAGARVDCAYSFQTSNYLGEERPYLGLDGLRSA